ncbi:hypothetical protein Ddye_027318 [Dipteronia dyeriana]|uniref:Pentatricopeptide repeat-containing protein n=1 Tax=Dipteronia dyeriana TaxID=168575 RepID=A0AAD9TPC5_9ROSI|nr:hypothetical protein Ddye_027318 [Dipteronia dyeriana]
MEVEDEEQRLKIINSQQISEREIVEFEREIRINEDLLGHEIIRVLPDAITYNTLIDGYCKKGKIGKLYRANAILNNKVESGIPADEFTFNIWIDGFCKDGNVLAVIKVFDEMKTQGVAVSLIMRTEDAFTLHNCMLDRGMLPNISTFNSLIGGLFSKGDTEGAKRLKNEWANKGLKIDNNSLG